MCICESCHKKDFFKKLNVEFCMARSYGHLKQNSVFTTFSLIFDHVIVSSIIRNMRYKM